MGLKLRLDLPSFEYPMDITGFPLGKLAAGRTGTTIQHPPILTAFLFSSSIRQLNSIFQINLNNAEPIPFVLDPDFILMKASAEGLRGR